MADLIRHGRQSYLAKKYSRASAFFTRAICICPCARGVKRDRCTCKNYEAVAAQGGSIVREAMYTCHCDVGRTFSKCDNVYHIQALNSRAATYGALGKLDRAVKDAEWMLELAPRLPDGYLRLGNIARLQKNDEYAWKVYTAGIEANSDTVVDSSPKLQQLYGARNPLNQRFFRQDPLRLPVEIVGLIFSYLSWTEILLVLRVSRKWKRELTSPVHGILWRTIHFPRESFKTMPRPGQVKNILSWAGDGGARKIMIDIGAGFPEPLMMQLLESSPSLENLEFHQPSDLSLPRNRKLWNQLRDVSISSESHSFCYSEVDSPGGFPRMFLQNAGSSLENLNLRGIPSQWYLEMASIPFLPNLKTLRLYATEDDDDMAFPIFSLSIPFPRLEQLDINDLLYLGLEPTEIWRGKWHDVWPHLKVLWFRSLFWSLGSDYESEISLMAIRYLTSLNSLQHIYLDFESEDWPHLFRDSHGLLSDLDVLQYSPSKNLRSCIINTPISPEGARSLVSNAIKTGQLTSFDLVFPVDHSERNFGETSIRHLKGYEWMRGSPSIHTLGCYEFRFPFDAETDDDMPLPQFLATFPNLRTLKISSLEYDTLEFAEVVVAVLEVTRLNTIYTPLVNGVFLDQLRELAQQQYGVQLLACYPEEPWPVPLGP
ncbi:uncharacterized protein CPUR_07788 [Claviceps purpurea 20.1]|uniref:F-box domain-containing protein n=1 Tax=Claviceps purpurea (strain 20.1) TaxID=1111077 RepID=M1WBW4_CLAP2|nr:uncharacterized protein CPUR_07788 [Claviceps purpurea 20.1]